METNMDKVKTMRKATKLHANFRSNMRKLNLPIYKSYDLTTMVTVKVWLTLKSH